MTASHESARVVIAPDSFKGSASASEVAAAIAAGWRSVRPDDHVVVAPMADGGEGTIDAFRSAYLDAQERPLTVLGPAGEPHRTSWLLLPDNTAIIELASTSGVSLLRELAPLDAHTFGFGQAIAAALASGASRLVLAIGSSASTDGGVGALTALGASFMNKSGRPVPLGGRGLAEIAAVDLSTLRPLPPGGVQILSDVTNPLLGPNGAAGVYGPQKGASADVIAKLEAGLRNLQQALGRADSAGAGAAGGTGYGLLAWGATLHSGASAVGDILGLPGIVQNADVLITGEGRYDSQSASGKVPHYVSQLGRANGRQTFLVAGAIAADTRGYGIALSLTDLAGGVDAATREPERWARTAGASLARVYPALRR
ncbi:glycerate kinase [Leifsonia shinshuensis]|uniref:Glycerate kinase n=1 Tax=Leifsonia shinshuensis TaxID=150026 RepID=A0A7G6YAC6_9MICO|nr:glycerate kinase [Leifsonia shinshuensis]QNE35441.1 glycerate kinase [Leifsonia shinshuensis]